ncbi:MAG: DUF367 domain-containing protein [Planctomycetaceae bacterium]
MSSSSLAFPPTLIVVHPREKRSKCTVECLRRRSGFEFRNFPVTPPPDLRNYVQLSIWGPELSAADAERGLLVLDGTWRLAERMAPFFKNVAPRSLPPWRTAYPRASKNYPDPNGGLATIEAIFAAYHVLGRDTAGLLDEYHWRDDFLKLNALE